MFKNFLKSICIPFFFFGISLFLQEPNISFCDVILIPRAEIYELVLKMDYDTLKKFCEEVHYLEMKEIERWVFQYGLAPLGGLVACLLVIIYPDSTYAELMGFVLLGIIYHTGLQLFPQDIYSDIDDIVSCVHQLSDRKWVQLVIEKYKIKYGLL